MLQFAAVAAVLVEPAFALAGVSASFASATLGTEKSSSSPKLSVPKSGR